MTEEKKRVSRKTIYKEILGGILLVGMLATGGYFLYQLSQSSKLKEQQTNSNFYSGCYNFCDSLERIQEVCPECIVIDYDKLTTKMKKDYINKNGLEEKVK